MARDKVQTPETMQHAQHGGRRHGEILVARRYLEHGFLDAAMRIFERNAALVTQADWTPLVERLLERGRMAEAIHVCRMGDLPLPRQQLLAFGDRQLRRRDLAGAIHYYELANADRERWSALVDVLSRLPDGELQAIAIAERHLVTGAQPAASPPLAASA
jgi:hypothetical protein